MNDALIHEIVIRFRGGASMRRIAQSRTVLIIAHRLSTVRQTDRIITIERGRVIEDGAHDELVNSGGRYGGAITAAMFLKEFAEDTPWLHLDIAGTAWMEENKPWIAKGPSGIAVRSLVEFARDFS